MSAPTRLHLIRHAPTAATRRSAFPRDEALDEAGRRDAERLAGTLRADRVLSSPARRCRQTADLAGLGAVEVDERLRELDFGAWAGRRLDEVSVADPERLRRWCEDPAGVAPPGGERLTALADRVDALLADLDGSGARVAVVTHGGPVKVAVLRVLGAPLDRLWDVEVAPCSVTELAAHGQRGRWRLVRCNVPAGVVRPVPAGEGA